MPPPHEVEFTKALLWLLVADIDTRHAEMGLCAEHQYDNDTYIKKMSYKEYHSIFKWFKLCFIMTLGDLV